MRPHERAWRFLDTHGEGVHHLTLQVEDLERVRQLLEERGIPSFGYGEPIAGWKELFIHPRDAFGVLIQFAQFRPLDWVKPGDPVPLPYQRQLPTTDRWQQPVRFKKLPADEGPVLEISQGETRIRLTPASIEALRREIDNL